MSDTKLYVKGESCCRGEVSRDYTTIPLSTILHAFTLQSCDDDDLITSWVKGLNEERSNEELLFTIIVNKYLAKTVDYAKHLNEKGYFYVDQDETIWSVGTTKELCRIGFDEMGGFPEDWD